MNEELKLNFSELPDDRLPMLWVDLDRPDFADQVNLLKDEIAKRVEKYLQAADGAFTSDSPDYDEVLDILDKARLLNDAPYILKKIEDVEKIREEKRNQNLNLSFDLENRLKQRNDMNKLKKAVTDAEKLDKDGLLLEELREVFHLARLYEGKNRETTGQVTTKGRTGDMKESKEGYDFLLSIKEGESNRSEVWDDVKGSYINIQSLAFETLLEETKNHWKKETESALRNFITDPKGDYLLKLSSDPTLVEASLERHFGHADKCLVHPDCFDAFEKLRIDIHTQAGLYRDAQDLYKKALASKDPLDAYERILSALRMFKLEHVQETGFRKRAQNFVFERLKKDAVHANELITRFAFQDYEKFVKTVWDYSEKLTALQQKDTTFLLGAKEIDVYVGRRETYQSTFLELEKKYQIVRGNYQRIDTRLKEFEDRILSQDVKRKINAAEWWDKLDDLLEQEVDLLGQTSKEKMYLVHFKARIDELRKELIPLQSAQKQLKLMGEWEQDPEKWADVLNTDESLRSTYPEAALVYSRVFIKSNIQALDASLRIGHFVAARMCLDELYQHDDKLRSQMIDQEKEVATAERLTTQAVHTFFETANRASSSSEIESMIEGWKMHRYLILEFQPQDVREDWPVLDGKCIYIALSRNKVLELAEKLDKEAVRVTSQIAKWIADKKIESISEIVQDLQKAPKDRIPENDPEFIKISVAVQLLRENHFLTPEQTKICKSAEFRRAKWLADQRLVQKDFDESNRIWSQMASAYPSDANVEKEFLNTKQETLLFQLERLLNKKDYQGALEKINEAERSNIAIVAQRYQIRLKHALVFEGLKQFESALRKLDDIKPDLLKLNTKEIKAIETERERLQIEYKIHRAIENYQNACDKEKGRYRSGPGFFNAVLIHLHELKRTKQQHINHAFLDQFIQSEISSQVNELEKLIRRNEHTKREEVRRDVFLYRLTLREFKVDFAAKVDDDLIESKTNQEEFAAVCDFIEAEFDTVNPAENNQSLFSVDDAERLAGSLSARDLAELMQRYYEQFNQLLKFDSNLEEKTLNIRSKAGEAIYIYDKLLELYERADVETSWEYTLRNGYSARAWELYFNGRNMAYGATIPQIKKRISYIQIHYLNNAILEIKEFNQKIADADLLKPIISEKINQITNGYSAYLDNRDNQSWTVSQDAKHVVDFHDAISDSIRTSLQYIQEEVYPDIIGFYNRVITYPAVDLNWSWKGFSECRSKAETIEENYKIWKSWNDGLDFVLEINQKAYNLAVWAGKDGVIVPWRDQDKQADVASADVIPERNWYLQVFSLNESWEIISPEGEKFTFKYKLDRPLPHAYQLWLWQNAGTRNGDAINLLKNGPRKQELDLGNVPSSELDHYPAYSRAAQSIRSNRQMNCGLLEAESNNIEVKTSGLQNAISFPSLAELDNWLRQGQITKLRTAIDKAKQIGPRNKREADYLRAKEVDLVDKEKNTGSRWFWSRSR